MSSIKRNYTFHLLNVLGGLLFPLITFPYTSRVLMADGLGTINFYQSIISYIALAAALGIPSYAVREIARVRDDRHRCAVTAVEVLLLHGAFTLLGYIIVGILVLFVPRIAQGAILFLLLSSSLALAVIGAGWFYHAVEDFKYITIRVTIVRLFLVVGLFLFVHEKEDLIIYSIIHVLGETGGNIFNFFRLRKYLRGTNLSLGELHPLRHLKPALQIFVLNVITSIYVSLDSVMLGFINDEVSVGYYTPPLRLARASIGIVSALGTVLLPRFSNMAINKRMDEFNSLAEKAIGFVIAFSLPMMVGLIALAPAAIHLFSGSNYEPSVLTLQLLAPIIPSIALSGIIGMQILYSQGKEKIVIRATAIGAISNFTLNLFLMPHYAQWGAAFSTSVAEISVTLMCIILGRRYFCFSFKSRRNLNYFAGTALLALWLLLLSRLIDNEMLLLLAAFPSSIVLYFGFLYLRGDRFAFQLISICRRWRDFLNRIAPLLRQREP